MEDKEPSLEESMLSWLETAKKPELKPSSFMRLYNTVTKQIIPRIGSCSISDLTVPYIEETLIMAMVRDGQSQSSVKKAKSALKSFYQYYLIHAGRYTETNFMTYIHVPNATAFGGERHIGYLTDKESIAFLKACKLDNTVQADALSFMLNTGLRVGECVALKWKDLDSSNHLLTIRRNALPVVDIDVLTGKRTKEKIHIQEMPKTMSGFRTIPLNTFCTDLLHARYKQLNPSNGEQLIFPSLSGTVLWVYNLRRSANRIMNELSIPREKHGLHILRHTYATALFAQGIDLKTVSYLLGHSSIQVTADNYIHITESFRYEIEERKFRPYPERFIK